MEKVKKESKTVSSEGTELKEWFVNMPGNHIFLGLHPKIVSFFNTLFY